MKKSIKIMGGSLVLAIVFGLGTFTGATTDWKTEVANEASSRIGAAGYNKKEEIIQKDVSAEIQTVLDPTIKQYEEELAVMLDEYYQLKLNEVVNGDEITALEQEMATTQQLIFERYKQDIDAMFGTTN